MVQAKRRVLTCTLACVPVHIWGYMATSTSAKGHFSQSYFVYSNTPLMTPIKIVFYAKRFSALFTLFIKKFLATAYKFNRKYSIFKMSLAHSHTDCSKSLDFIAGGLAGATATAATYPLEVLQTRLQSSAFNVRRVNSRRSPCGFGQKMIQNEGYSFFRRGLGASIMAVSLSRAIYFPVYSSCKRFLGKGQSETQSAIVHSSSAAIAGLVACTLTNPIWFLKTRIQLDSGVNKRHWLTMPYAIYKNEGIRVFFSGLAASYLGIAETVLQFAIYEYLRRIIRERESTRCSDATYLSDCMLAGAAAKTVAATIAYPHEVFRTRTREPQNIGKSFRTLFRTILRDEGWQAFYRGLGIHLIRQVPNSAILFLTYEAIIYFAHSSQS